MPVYSGNGDCDEYPDNWINERIYAYPAEKYIRITMLNVLYFFKYALILCRAFSRTLR